MKHLILIFLFSGSLDSFSQQLPGELPKSEYTLEVKPATGYLVECCKMITKPDTLRATLIVYFDRGPAILHTKPGFVVRQFGKDEVYLDDRKRVIKGLEVLTYKLKK